jgi:hypothetical protein
MYSLTDLKNAFEAGRACVNAPQQAPEEAFNIFFLTIPKPEEKEEPKPEEKEELKPEAHE